MEPERGGKLPAARAMTTEPCPCGTGRALADCCGPFLAGAAFPPNAEALMRSRYTAFAERDWDYLARTQAGRDRSEPTPDIEWLGLTVLAAHGGGAEETEGTVEFVARYRHRGKAAELHEISRFGKRDGRWIYFDGRFSGATKTAKPGRNDPCPCGSGRKYKKCCGHD